MTELFYEYRVMQITMQKRCSADQATVVVGWGGPTDINDTFQISRSVTFRSGMTRFKCSAC